MKVGIILFVGWVLELTSLLTFAQNIVIDPWTSDDNEDFDLYDIIMMAEAGLEYPPDELTDEEREEAVRVHNAYRSNTTTLPIVQASDMLYMEYNRSLEHAAKIYSTLCIFDHGRHPNDTIGKEAGQNLYRGPSRSLVRGFYLYYEEYRLYSYEDRYCYHKGQKHPDCGHFMVMMFSQTHQIGCGRTRCRPLDDTYIHACHYWPRRRSSKIGNTTLYQYGRPCSRNPWGDGNLCHKNLCVNKTLSKKYNLDTTCESFCQNCAVNNVKKCTCECKVGWDFADCAEPCSDYASKNDDCSRSYKYYKCDDFYRYNMFCRKCCGQCKVINQSEIISNPKKPPPNEEMCCGGKMCDRYYVLNNKCECELLCPSQPCMYNVTNVIPASSGATSDRIEPDFKGLFLLMMTSFAYYVLTTFIL